MKEIDGSGGASKFAVLLLSGSFCALVSDVSSNLGISTSICDYELVISCAVSRLLLERLRRNSSYILKYLVLSGSFQITEMIRIAISGPVGFVSEISSSSLTGSLGICP